MGVLSLLKERKTSGEKVLLTAFDNLKDTVRGPSSQSGDESGIALSNSNSQSFALNDTNNKNEIQIASVKKRHRRMKSSGQKNDNDGKIPKSYDIFHYFQ